MTLIPPRDPNKARVPHSCHLMIPVPAEGTIYVCTSTKGYHGCGKAWYTKSFLDPWDCPYLRWTPVRWYNFKLWERIEEYEPDDFNM